MSRTEERWIKIARRTKDDLQVETPNSCYRDSVVLQTELGAMIEVGAIVGANILHLNNGDVLEIKLIMHRKEGDDD